MAVVIRDENKPVYNVHVCLELADSVMALGLPSILKDVLDAEFARVRIEVERAIEDFNCNRKNEFRIHCGGGYATVSAPNAASAARLKKLFDLASELNSLTSLK